MPTDATRDDVQRLVAAGAQLVEVLPRDEYDWGHLQGAVHVPLRGFDPSLLDSTG